MEPLLSAIVGDLVTRALSMMVKRYVQYKGAEEKLEKLQRLKGLLLRIDAAIEEAEGRHITNQAMLQQLQMLRQGSVLQVPDVRSSPCAMPRAWRACLTLEAAIIWTRCLVASRG